MSRWIEDKKNTQAIFIVATTCAVIAVAFGLAESAAQGSESFELLLILLLVAPSLCLPALAFRSHARSKERSREIIRTKSMHLNLVLENMIQGVCMFDADKRVIVCNQRYAEMYGLSPEIILPGTTFREILQYRISNGSFAGDDPESYIQERLDAVSERHQSDKVHKLRDGRYIAIRHTPMPGGGWLGTHEDVTERMRAEKALMESEAQLRAIFDNAPFCVNLKDLDGKYIYANKKYGEWWGCPVEEAIGKTAVEFHECTERVKECSELEKLVIETGETNEREIGIDRDNNGHIYHRLFIKFPVKSPGGDMMALGTFAVDITERKRAEDELISHRDHLQDLVHAATHDLKQQAKELEMALTREKEVNELQRQFISMASHEFRTPLAIIDSTAQRLRKSSESTTPEDILKRTEKIRSAVSRMTHLMESTLTAARMENGGISFQAGDCNIASLLWDVCERQSEVSESHVISCDVTALPPSIRADASALEQVFTNLVGNAVKYTPENPEIDVVATTDGSDIVVTIRDNGIGIDPEDLARIGERFFRAKSSMGIAGTGIGLNLVKTLVELHEGSMHIKSELDKGSVFTIRLPIAGPAEAEPESDDTAEDAPTTNAA